MTPNRRLLRSLLFACLATFPMVAHAAVTELRVLFDTDHNPATGCTVNGMSGVEQVLVTQITDDGTTANVTQTHRLICAGGVLSGPVDVNTNGAAVGFQSSSGSMLLEAAIPFSAFGSGMPSPMRVGFAGTRGGASFSVITQSNGDALMFPRGPAGRRHAVAHPGPDRVIILDGLDPDWNGISPLAPGSAGGGATDIKLVQAFAFANPNDNTLYFKFNVNTKGSGIQAVNDIYVRTQGEPALTEPPPGVLGNDISNGVPLTAVPVGGPDHGQLTLGSDGGFTYEPNDPDSLETDTFFYKATHDTDESNVASVQILVEQNSEPPAFTSADSVQLQVGQPANFTVTTSGVPPPAITRSGALPPGVTFTDNGDGTATIGGIPTVGGSYPLVFTAINGAGNATQNFTIIVCGNIVVTNPVNTNGTAGAPFSETFTQTGAVGSATFSLFSGTLPAGLTLDTNGTLSGTPTVTGSFPIRVRVTDTNGCTGTGAIYTLVIGCQTITVTNPVTNTGTAGAAFSQTFTQSGAIGGVTFSLNSGVLPAGLTLAANGTLAGTPTHTGSFPITVRATDSNGCFGVGATYTLTIGCQTITVTNPATSTGTAGVAFSQTFTQTGAIGGATFTTASTLPAGLTLAANGTLSGTPTQTGSFPIVVTVTDGNGCTGTSATYSLVINCPTITVTNPANTAGTVNAAFSETFTQTSAVGGATFTLNSGVLPAGLTLSTGGVLAGIPTEDGSFPITVLVTDGNGCTGVSATYNLAINCQTITVTNPSNATGPAGTPFSETFTQTGGILPVTFTTSSTLPAGLSLSTAGVLSGTPSQGGTFPITVLVTDANGCTGTSAVYTLVITCPTITVTNPANTNGTANAAFSETFTQTGAVGGATFTTSSTLPTGLLLSAAGVLSGTPTQTGTFPITVLVTDGNGCTGTSAVYNLFIACQTITVTNPGVNTGTVNIGFSQTFMQSGAIGAATFTTASTLPAGLTLATNGTLSGTPTQTGSFPIVVTVTDSNGCTGTGATYTLTIGCQVITVNNPANTNGTVSASFSETFTASNTIGAVTFSTASTLPAGLSLSAGGVLSGTPTQTGSFPIVVTATDANGCTGSGATYTLIIGCQTITVTSPANTSGTVNVAFSETFTQTGAILPATFTLNSGVLPTGLTLSTGGVLAGIPTQSGSFPITVLVTDANSCTGVSATYTLVINCQTITVTNPSNATGPAGTPFSETFTQTGGILPVSFTTSSTLPTGLTLSTAGVLSGTPMQGGTFPIVVTVTDANGCTGTGATYTLVITCPTITVINPANTNGTANAAFSETFTQTGAVGGATFTTSSTLPTGLLLSAAGVLSGTPTQTGAFPITVLVTDGNGCTGTSAVYNLFIACQTITVNNPGNSNGTANSSFSETFTQTNAIGATTFTLNSGTLPAGLSLSAGGVLSGIPTQTGSFPITVLVTDANGCTGTSATYTINIACQVITVNNPGVNTGTVNAPFSATFTTTNAIGTVTFSTSSTLPAGLSLSSGGVLSGTPTQSGLFPIVVTVTDGNGCPGTGATYNLTINCQTITVTNPANTSGTVNVAFSEQFTQAGAFGGATFSTASTLPTGLTLSASGLLSGLPTQAGTFNIVVTVTDANGCTGTGATYALVIGCQTITVTSPSNTIGTAGSFFTETFTQSGGVGAITWSVTGTLPIGITIDSSTGVLSGTTSQVGIFPITVTATDANLCTGTSATYNLTINCQTITITNPAQTSVQAGTALSAFFTATGILGTANWTIDSGTLPTGITLNASTGELAGTTNQQGTFPVVVKVTDTNGCSATSSYTLTVVCPVITVARTGGGTFPAGTFNTAYAGQSFAGSGGTAPYTFAVTSGTFPTGLTLAANGTISGTPTQTGTFIFTVTGTDANLCAGSQSFTIAINPAAAGDTYNNLVNNTEAVVTGGATSSPTTPFVPLTGSILANDLPSGGVAVVPGTFATTQGGSVTIAADGTFKYTPPVTVSALTTDSFNYTISSNTGGTGTPTQASGTVTLNLLNRVWYVKNNGAAGNGQSQAPFNTLAAAQAPSTAGDIIYVYNGDGTTTGHTAGIVLKNTQQLIGEGVALVVNTHTLVVAGTKPQITNLTAASDAVTLADGNTVRGLTVTGATRDGISSVVAHAGFTGDTLTVQNNTNIGVNLKSMTGTVTITNSTISTVGNQALTIDGGTAAVTVDNTNTVDGGTGTSVSVLNRPAAAGAIAIGATITAGRIQILSNTSGTISFTGSQTIASTTNPAVTMTTNTGATINFSGTLAITTTTGSGFVASGGGTLNVSGTANITTGAAGNGLSLNGMTIGGTGVAFNSVNTTGATTGIALTNVTGTVSVNGGTISNGATGVSLQGASTNLSLAGVTITGPTTGIASTTNFGTLTIGSSVTISAATALNLTTGAVTGTFASVTSTGGTNGVNLNAVTGTWGTSGGSLNGASGSTFNVNGGGGGTIAWGAAIGQGNAANVVTIASSNSNTINFNASVSTTGTSTGISISASSGTYNFNGSGNTIAGSGGGITISNGQSGTIFFSSGTSITTSGTPFTVAGAAAVSANITYSGTINKTSTGTLLNINLLSGSLVFNGTTLSGSTNLAAGVVATISNVTGTLTANHLSLDSSEANFGPATLLSISGTNTGSVMTFHHLVLSANGANAQGAGLVASGGGTVTVTNTGGNSAITTRNAVGLSLTGVAMGASAINSINVAGGAGTVNGIALTTTTGSLTISGGTLAGATGFAIVGNSFGSLNTSGMTINNAAGGGMSLTTGALSGSFTSFSSTGGTHGLLLSAVSGTFTAAAGTINNPTTAGMSITGLNPSVSLTGTISISNGRPGILTSNMTGGSITVSTVNVSGTLAGQDAITLDGTNSDVDLSITSATLNTSAMDDGLVLSDLSSGTSVTISGGSITSTGSGRRVFEIAGTVNCACNLSAVTLNANTSDGISLPSTHLGTYQFGDLDVNTPNGGIGVRVAGDSSTANTDSSVTFRSIDIATCSNVGIYVHDHSGSFTVSGTGAASSGGTISTCTNRGARFGDSSAAANGAKNISLTDMVFNNNGVGNVTVAGSGDGYNGTNTNFGAGIDLQNADTVNLTRLTISNGDQFGINGRNVNALTLNTVEVNNNGGETFEDGIQIHNLTGTTTWTSVNVHDNAARQVEIQNASGVNNLTVSGTSFFRNAVFQGSTMGSNCFLFSGHGTSNVTVNIVGAEFARCYGSAFFSDIADSASANVTVNGGKMEDNGLMLEGGGIGTGNMTYTLTNLTSAYSDPAHTNSSPIGFLKGAGASGTFTGVISNNQIGNAAIASSSGPCAGCATMLMTNGGTSGTHNLTISGNTFRRSGDGVINVTTGVNTFNDSGQMNVKILNNVITSPDASSDLPITVVNGTDPGDTSRTCADILGNVIDDPAGGGSWNAGAFIRLRHVQNNTVFRMPGYVGGGTDDAAVHTYLSGRNTLTGGVPAVTRGAGPGTWGNTSPAGSQCF